MFMFSRTIAIGFALLGASQALAIDKQLSKKFTDSGIEIVEKLQTSIKVSTTIRPMTTQEDIAAQLLGPGLISPLAEYLAK